MRTPGSETIVVKPELIRLVRRGDSKKWQVHYKLDGIKTWFRRSSDTADVKAASAIAERMWMKATFDHEAGRPVISKKFKPVAEMVLHRLDAEIKAGTARPSTKDYVSAIRLYLIPFYGAYNIGGIKPSVVSEFHTWRSIKVGRELSGSAQNNHNAALNLIFDEAVQRGFLTEYQRPATKNTGSESDRRAEFSHEELEKIMGYAPTFIGAARTSRTRMIRELLAIYVSFMAATGMRAGTEAEFLEWRHIDVEVRQYYAAMVSHLDGLVAPLVDALKAKGMWDNLLFVLSAGACGVVVAQHGDMSCFTTPFITACRQWRAHL
jgi:hypothetical protein